VELLGHALVEEQVVGRRRIHAEDAHLAFDRGRDERVGIGIGAQVAHAMGAKPVAAGARLLAPTTRPRRLPASWMPPSDLWK
jgi:hypothetical protein